MRTLFTAMLILVSGYLAGAVGGYALVQALSSNTHDRDVEAAMTGAFVIGPVVGLGAIAFWLVMCRKA